MSNRLLVGGFWRGPKRIRAVRAQLLFQVKGARAEIDDAVVLAEDL